VSIVTQSYFWDRKPKKPLVGRRRRRRRKSSVKSAQVGKLN